MPTLRRLHQEILRWATSFGVSAEIPLVEVVLRSPGSRFGLPGVTLYEEASTEFLRLLMLDITARTGRSSPRDSAADEATVAALRLRDIDRLDLLGRERRPRHPGAAEKVVESVRSLLDAAGRIADDMLRAAWRPGDDADRIVDDVLAALAAATSAVDRFTATTDDVVPARHWSRDGATLADQFLLVCCPGSYPMSVHVRIFRPASGDRVIVLGELGDYHSPGVVTGASAVMEAISTMLPHVVAEPTTWIHYLPAEYVTYSPRYLDEDDPETAMPTSDSARRLVPFGAREIHIEDLDIDELEHIVDGRFRRWHAAAYRSSTLVADGIRVLDAVVSPRRLHPALVEDLPDDVMLECRRRWRCGMRFTVPLEKLVFACCPSCGSASTQPVGLF